MHMKANKLEVENIVNLKANKFDFELQQKTLEILHQQILHADVTLMELIKMLVTNTKESEG